MFDHLIRRNAEQRRKANRERQSVQIMARRRKKACRSRDGLSNDFERNTGYYTGTDPLGVDSDGDKLTDYEEVMGRTIQIEINNLPGADITYTATSDPTKTNSDNDVLDDYQEKQYGTDPRYEDTDNDGIMDGDELIDEFGGGWMAAGDTDSDGTPNGPTDWDSNGNARSDGLEKVVSNFPAPGQAGYDPNADYDGDGLTNGQEHTIDYNPNLDGVQGTSYLTPDSDNDGFWDGADYGLGTSYSLPVKTRLPTGTYTTVWYTVKVVVSMDIQPGEGYLAPASAVGDGKKGTSPLKDDEEKDGTRDGYDIDPLVDLEVTISITEILALDDVDKDPLFGDNPADFFVRISCDMAKWSFLWFESSGYYYSTRRTAEPIKEDDDHLTPDELVDAKFTFNVPDNEENRTFYINLFDDDGSDDKDDWCDISGDSTVSADEYSPQSDDDGRRVLLVYSLKTGTWGGEDYPGDPNGYGHVSGTEDGDSRDQDDCELWFDITQTDKDEDGLTWWQEVEVGTDPTSIDGPTAACPLGDIDNDGLPNWYEDKYCTLSTPSITWMAPELGPEDAPGANGDQDSDGLSNLGEYKFRGFNSNPDHPDLFVEIDYLEGCGIFPSATNTIEYWTKVFSAIRATSSVTSISGGIHLVIHIDEQVPMGRDWIIGSGATISLTSNEDIDSQLASYIENDYHDYHNTHVYCLIVGTTSLDREDLDPQTGQMVPYHPLGWAGSTWGFMIAENHNANEYDWQHTFAHELGHCVGIGLEQEEAYSRLTGDHIHVEWPCELEPSCFMSDSEPENVNHYCSGCINGCIMPNNYFIPDGYDETYLNYINLNTRLWNKFSVTGENDCYMG